MIILVYPFIFTGEELRYDYGFPHAEWRRNPQAPGTKSNIDNIEAANSKNKISRNVDEPFITVTRRKKLETLFKLSGLEKEKPGDSEKRVASTTQRKGEESEVPVEVSNLYPNLSAKNLTIPLQPVLLESWNKSINIEIQNAGDIVEKPPNPLHNVVGDTEQRISTKSLQNQSSKVEKNKTTDTEEKAPNPLRKDGEGTEPRISTKSSQNQSSKVEKNKTTDTEEKAPNPLRKDGEGTESRISTKSSQNQSSKVEKNKTTDTEAKSPKQPRKPKNVTRSNEASYAKLTKLEERKPKTHFGAKNEWIIPQKVSAISLITRLRFEITDFLKKLFWLRLHLKVKAIWWLSCTSFIEVPQDFKIMLNFFFELLSLIMWKEMQCDWGMLDWILHVKTNALWKNVDLNASSSGNNLNKILVQKEATVVL